MAFPSDFRWGAATSAYQIEGAAATDGKGPSIWDEFCRKPGAIHLGHTGDIACDHYHRLTEDVRLMKEMGLNAYRFSVSWSRVLPDGTGACNKGGLDFYDRLTDLLLDAGIEPWLTLYHWDLPLALERRGGWLNTDSPDWFSEYASTIATRLGDRVRHWMTFNEQPCFLVGGYLDGWHAPGRKEGWKGFLLANKHVQIAHGKACRALRAACPRPPKIGFAGVAMGAIPESESPEDIEAARLWMFQYRERTNWHAMLYCEPMMSGRLDPDVQEILREDLPSYSDEELSAIHQPLDFLGLNSYEGPTIRMGETGPEKVPPTAGRPIAGQYWQLTPEVHYWTVRCWSERYGLPVAITENGVSLPDWVALDGRVHDPARIDHCHRYLLSLKRAVDEGFDVLGYFHWSLMDNLEWAEGYRQKFGLIHVDMDTLVRTRKDSSYWYSDVIRTNGANL